MSYRLRARYIAKKRMAVIVTAFVLFTSLLLLNLFKLQCLQNTYYQNKVYEQITTSTKLRAKRGNIYDSHMNLLACEKTTWRIFVMAQDVKKRIKTTGTDYARVIAEGLATILELDYLFYITKLRIPPLSISRSPQRLRRRLTKRCLPSFGNRILNRWFRPRRKAAAIIQTARHLPTFSALRAATCRGFTGWSINTTKNCPAKTAVISMPKMPEATFCRRNRICLTALFISLLLSVPAFFLLTSHAS